MSDFRLMWRPAAAGILLLAGGGATGAAQTDRAALTALKQVERGQWQLRDRGGAQQQLCVRDPAALLRIRHGATQCTQFVVENSARVATIQYTCPGHGHGRTTITVETPRLLRIETQGVVDGAPFIADMEGRRTGACGASDTSR
jgi:hypothetical protein